MHDYFGAGHFFNLTIWRQIAPAFKNINRNSLQPKKHNILEETPDLLGEKLTTRTNNLHHRKAGSVTVIKSLRVGVQHKQTVMQKNCNHGGSKMYTVFWKAS